MTKVEATKFVKSLAKAGTQRAAARAQGCAQSMISQRLSNARSVLGVKAVNDILAAAKRAAKAAVAAKTVKAVPAQATKKPNKLTTAAPAPSRTLPRSQTGLSPAYGAKLSPKKLAPTPAMPTPTRTSAEAVKRMAVEVKELRLPTPSNTTAAKSKRSAKMSDMALASQPKKNHTLTPAKSFTKKAATAKADIEQHHAITGRSVSGKAISAPAKIASMRAAHKR